MKVVVVGATGNVGREMLNILAEREFPADEIVALARVAGKFGGLYATHMRNEGDRVADAIRESILIGEQAGLPVDISHFKISNKKLWGQSPMTLGLVREARARGLRSAPVVAERFGCRRD